MNHCKFSSDFVIFVFKFKGYLKFFEHNWHHKYIRMRFSQKLRGAFSLFFFFILSFQTNMNGLLHKLFKIEQKIC